MEKEFIAAFSTADAVITGVQAGLAARRAVLTQLSGGVCVGAGWTLRDTRTVLIQEISCDTQMHARNAQKELELIFQFTVRHEDGKYLYL